MSDTSIVISWPRKTGLIRHYRVTLWLCFLPLLQAHSLTLTYMLADCVLHTWTAHLDCTPRWLIPAICEPSHWPTAQSMNHDSKNTGVTGVSLHQKERNNTLPCKYAWDAFNCKLDESDPTKFFDWSWLAATFECKYNVTIKKWTMKISHWSRHIGRILSGYVMYNW